MKFSAKTLGAVLCGVAFSMSSALAVAEPIVIKFSHVVAVDTPKGKAADFFKKRAEELTAGKVKVEVYPNSQLYKDKEEMEALQLGAVQMLAPSLAKFGPLGVKEFEVFDLPYIFDGYDDLHKVTNGPVGKKLLEKLEPKGINGLAYWDNGFKVFSSNKPIKSRGRLQGPEDAHPVLEGAGGADARPRRHPAGDGLLGGLPGAADRRGGRHGEPAVQPLHPEDARGAEVRRVSDHGYLGYAVIVNKKFWEGLPADVRGQLEKAMTEATDYANKIAKEENDQSLEAVRKAGKTEVFTPTPVEHAALRAKLIPVHQEVASRVGKELIDADLQATGFKP